MLDLWREYGWVPILAALIIFWTLSARSYRARSKRLVAVAAICDTHGMGRVDNPGPLLMPQMLPIGAPEVRWAFANGDWSLWLSEVRGRKDANVFAILMFSAEGLNLPYVAVGRKGAVDMALGSRGQTVGLESIDFNNRFQIRADDPRAAVMLVDQGMMQWLLDLDQISFQITGPLITAIVKESRTSASSLTEVELLFKFCDGLAAHIPRLTFSEYPAPDGLAAATVQAMRIAPNLLSNLTSGGS